MLWLYSSFLYFQKEYARYKQAKGWKHLVVYKSGIHALGLYTSRFISRGAMVRSSSQVQIHKLLLCYDLKNVIGSYVFAGC